MGRPSDLAKAHPATEIDRELAIIDVFNHKAGNALPFPPGVILVLDAFRPADREALVDRYALIRTPGGLSALAKVSATRDHGSTISILIGGLSSETIPIGSTVSFPASSFHHNSILREKASINTTFETLLRLTRDQLIEGTDLDTEPADHH